MKLGQISDKKFRETLAHLMGQKLPIKTAYKLKSELDKIQVELVKYEELRQTLLNKYGKKNKAGVLELDKLKNVKFDKDSFALFIAELEELNSIDVEVKSISIDELGDKIEVSVEDLILLKGIIN